VLVTEIINEIASGHIVSHIKKIFVYFTD